jgi:photosystem II stability/assembly factor-like uncharacterized protein
MRLLAIMSFHLWAVMTVSAGIPDYERSPALTAVAAESGVLLDIAQAGDKLVAVGERGLIIYSDDGRSWQQAKVPLSETLTAVSFVSAEQGWAVGHGGTILHSSDGGKSWQLQFDGDQANHQWLAYTKARRGELDVQIQNLEQTSSGEDSDLLSNLRIEQEDAGFAVEDAELAVTTGPADPFLDIWFGDASKGIAVGAYGMIYRTDNGGKDWKLAAAGIKNSYRYHYYSLTADAAGRLFISGEAGLMYRSLDGGKQWQLLGPFYDGSLFGVLSHDDAILSYGLRGNVFRSSDGGDSWQTLNEDIPFSLYGGSTLSNGNIVLVGSAGGIAISEDGGDTFTTQDHPSRSSFSAVTGDASNAVYVVGMSGVVSIIKRGAL